MAIGGDRYADMACKRGSEYKALKRKVCLDVNEQLSALHGLNDGDPCDGDGNKKEKEKPSNNEQLLGRGGRPQLSVDVHREEGGGRVEDGGEVGHESGQHDGQHHSSQALWHDAKNERGEGCVAAGYRVATDRLADSWVDTTNCVRVEHSAYHPGHHDQEHGQHLVIDCYRIFIQFLHRTLIHPVKIVAP